MSAPYIEVVSTMISYPNRDGFMTKVKHSDITGSHKTQINGFNQVFTAETTPNDSVNYFSEKIT
jgi:hypothetical protein